MNIYENGLIEVPGTGYLQVLVYGISQANPISGALVDIIDSNSDNIIKSILTNDEGQTKLVKFDTPPLQFSFDPNAPKPYTTCNIRVTKDKYNPFFINEIQIFPDSTSLQLVNLNLEFPSETPEIVVIEPPVLWGDFPPKIPEADVKNLSMFSGLVVLPEVVIPDTIIVHNGVPDDKDVMNIKVSFKEYIKNVTSCEIYPNWPREAIKANVLAIISFTLNRIYTEWYRSKGYNFNITSSTAHDQAFDYKRNSFQEVSEIVDDIFNKYITKPNIKQPLLTQYCDGEKSQCPNWMSQWGAKFLGDQGHDAEYILKYYYGSTIYITEAKRVATVPQSFKGNLSVGSKGSEVRVIQEQLNAISKNYPLIPKNKVDGNYGDNTKKAVEIFQKTFNLPVTGNVNSATWYKISEIYVAVMKMAQLQ